LEMTYRSLPPKNEITKNNNRTTTTTT